MARSGELEGELLAFAQGKRPGDLGEDQAAFIEFFGTDFVVLTGAEAEAQLREFRRGRTGDSAVLEWTLPEQATRSLSA